jgi:hypothetical protein
LRFSASTTVVVLLAGVLTISAARPAYAAPAHFQVPFPCGELWNGNTYDNHGGPGRFAIDFAIRGQSSPNRAVVASAAGRVTFAGWDERGGNWLVIDHGDGWTTSYGHLSQFSVAAGQQVGGDTVVGYTGATGHVSPVGFAHLHYEQKLRNQIQPATFAGEPFHYTTGWINGGTPVRRTCGPPPSPIGAFELAAPLANGTGIRVAGWTFDMDAVWRNNDVHVYVDGVGYNIGAATLSRPDVEAAYPGVTPYHGFDAEINYAIGGRHTVCAFGTNVPGTPGDNILLGCKEVVIPNPLGSFEAASALADGSGIRVAGWTFDADAVWRNNDVAVYLDGVEVYRGPSSLSRPDVEQAYPGVTPYHGFDATIGASTGGRHNVCVWAVNVPGSNGTHTLLGCKEVLVPNPIGNLEAAVATGGGIRVAGWTFDADLAWGNNHVEIRIGANRYDAGPATLSRPDVEAAYPGVTAFHGYDAVVPHTAPGRHTVCAWGRNFPGTNGADALLGCRTVTR